MDSFLEQYIGIDASNLSVWWRLAIVFGIVVLAYLADFILVNLLIPAIRKITTKTDTEIDDIILSDKVCHAFSAIVPPVILSFALPFALQGNVRLVVERLTAIYIVINVCRFLTTLIGAFHNVFLHKGNKRAKSLKGIVQTFQVCVWLVGTIAMVSILLNRSPLILLGGIGAFATVMMLVFQDSIKGLVAGIQLSLNDMVRPGDWIAMKSRGVDGVVKEITLTTVKVQNWDNTILTIQPYALITETFQNWKGMNESDGRRICCQIHVNIHSVRLCSSTEFKSWQSKGYFAADATMETSTNLEAFRSFILKYLCNNPKINTNMTCMVRLLSADFEGIPIQLYCFSHTKVWEEYEEIQAQLVEYVISTMRDFGIYPYQRGCGSDSILLHPNK